jgi:hypothetical protein
MDLIAGVLVLLEENLTGCLVAVLVLAAIIFFGVTSSPWHLLLLIPFGMLIKMSVH